MHVKVNFRIQISFLTANLCMKSLEFFPVFFKHPTSACHTIPVHLTTIYRSEFCNNSHEMLLLQALTNFIKLTFLSSTLFNGGAPRSRSFKSNFDHKPSRCRLRPSPTGTTTNFLSNTNIVEIKNDFVSRNCILLIELTTC